jgi:TetR/AcrR family transcriptional regulator, fatty acid metabolism regulator protein
MKSKKEGPDRTFIEGVRRAQIVQCAADVIAESGYARATMAEIAKRAGIAKSVISYHFVDKNELMQEIIRIAFETYTGLLESRMAAESTVSGMIRAYLAASADYMTEHRSLNLAILEIAFNALGPDDQPLRATMPLEVHSSVLDQAIRDAQVAGEMREFDIPVMTGLLRSAVTHTMVMAIRADPGADLAAYARELGTTFDLATRPRGS